MPTSGLINVLQVLPELDPGGAERIVLYLTRHLPRERFRVSIAALDGRGALAEEFRGLGCEVTDLGGRTRLAPLAMVALSQLIHRTRPTIVHSHLFRAHLATALATRVALAPVTIATEHQADPRPWALKWLRRTMRKQTTLTAVSEAVRRHLINHGFPPDRVVALPNGIELEPFDSARPLPRRELTFAELEPADGEPSGPAPGAADHPSEAAAARGSAIPDDARLMIFIGRISRQKGLDVLLQAISALAADWPHLHLLVVGEGPERRDHEKLAEWLGIGPRVHFLGRRADVPALLKTAEIAVLPSRWEGLSLVLLEAMASGRPVVATEVEGSAEVLRHEETGLLVPPENMEALAAALKSLLADRGLGRRLGESASQAVRQEWTAALMARRYAELYDRLLLALQ